MPAIRFILFALGLVSAFAASSTSDGIAAFRQGRYSVALQQLQQAVTANPADEQSQVFLALTKAALNDCASALPVLKQHLATKDSALTRLDGLAAAKCEAASGNDVDALAVLTRLEKQFPSDADVIYSIARLHMKAFNDATLAMFQRTPSSYRVHQLSAEIFEAQSQFEPAVEEYRKAIALNAKAPDLHYRLGRAILMKSHDAQALKDAKAEFETELQLSPEDAATAFQLGQIAQVEGHADDAAQHWQRALKLSPDFPEALVALGKLRAQAKQYDAALPLLRRAVELQPANEAAHYALMMAYRDNGQTAAAKAEKATLDRLQRPPEGEFTNFLKKLGEKTPEQ
jgi:tetratricopeptide (TPR) repeat protein